MIDRGVLETIQELAEEERQLREHGEGRGLTPEEQARLHAIEVHLDQAWDLLRQVRGRRDAGRNPGDAHVRDAATVERYEQ